MKIVVTYSPHLKKWLSDIAIAVGNAFTELGYVSDVIPLKSLSSLYTSEYNIIFVIAPHGYQETRQVLNKHPNKIYVGWDLEQTPYLDLYNDKTILRFKKTLEYYHHYDVFFTESQGKTDYFLARGYSAHTLNFGYHHHYTKRAKQIEKRYDVFFVGIMFPRRKFILDQLKNRGVHVYPIIGDFFDPELKAAAVHNSKICLNIHHTNIDYFEKPRIIQDILSNQGFCITETIAYPEDFISGEHLVMSSYESLVDTVLLYLSRDEERDRIAKQGFKFIQNEYCLTNFLREVLILLNRQSKLC